MERLDIQELCLIKMLLIKHGNFLNCSISIGDIARITGIGREYFIKPLRHLLQAQIISFSNVQIDPDDSSKTMDEYLLSIEQNIFTKSTRHSSFTIEITKDKLTKRLDDYLAQYREDKFKSKNKYDFKTQEKIIRSLIADITSNKVTELTEDEKNSPFGIEVLIDGESIDYEKFDLLEILLIIEKDRLIKITNIALNTTIDCMNIDNVKSTDYCASVNLLVANYQRNEILQSNNSDKAINYRFSNYDKPHGWLKIGNYPEMSFSKMPALIVFYFYEASKIDKSYKNYQDFNAFYLKYKQSITSDEFNKKISLINKQINRETKTIIKEIITRGENKKLEANIYRWIINLP